MEKGSMAAHGDPRPTRTLLLTTLSREQRSSFFFPGFYEAAARTQVTYYPGTYCGCCCCSSSRSSNRRVVHPSWETTPRDFRDVVAVLLHLACQILHTAVVREDVPIVDVNIIDYK